MKRIGLLIFALLLFAGYQQAAAQSDIELTDSISNEWGGDTGGGIAPIIPSVPVTSLTISQTSITIEGGESYRLVANTNSDAGNKKIAWSIEDKSIAYVTSNGTVHGLKAGTTTVTATSVSNPDMTVSCRVTVTSDYVVLSSGWILPWGKEEAWEMNYLYYEQSNYKEPALDGNGKNWKELGYNDSAWRTLTGPMGSPGTTYSSYNYEWKGEYNCFCLRRTFTLPVVGEGAYSFYMQHDDDIVVYLNGEEVIKESGWTDEKISTYTIPYDKFVAGENILAIFIKQNHGGAFLDYSLYYKGTEKPSDWYDVGFLPDVDFEFFYDAKSYDEATQSIPNHEASNLAGHKLKLTANIPSFKNNSYLSLEKRCEGYIDRWAKGSTESGAYFYRSGRDCMTIVCKVKPKMNSGNASDLISNRGGGYNYMFRVGDHNSFFLHTSIAYGESRAIGLHETDDPQVLAVRVDGNKDYIQLDNFTTGESLRIPSIGWGGSNNIMKFFYNDNNEYYTGDVYWMYYSKNYVADEDLRGLVSYGMRRSFDLTYIVDGEVYSVERLDEGAEITPIIPYKEGYTFKEWSGLPKNMPARNVTVTAVFTLNTYNLIYMVDGKEYKRVPVKFGEAIVPESAPVKEGYTFSGWSEIPATMPARDVTVNGTFAVNSYNLIYMVDGKEYKRVSLKFGEAIVPESAPVKEGYTFSGWSEIPATMPLNDVTVTGSFTANTYNLIYMVDGKEYKRVSLKFGDAIVPESAPVKEGHTFSGWNGIPATMPAKDVTVRGTFAINYYDIIYIVDGKEYKRVSLKFGDAIVPESAPVKEGYTFSGWSGIPATMPAGDVTVNGTFAANSYNLIYVVDGKEYKRVPVKFGETIVPESEPVKEGYSFSGWKGIPSTMPAKDVTVRGTFVINYYDITYIVDGDVYMVVSVAYGARIVLIDEPVKEEHTFSGWSEAPEIMPANDLVITGSFEFTDIDSPVVEKVGVDVYSLQGTLLYRNLKDLNILPTGIYIINREKVFIK